VAVAGRRVATKKRSPGWITDGQRWVLGGRGASGKRTLLHQLGTGSTVNTAIVLVQRIHIRCIRRVDPQLEIRVVGGRGVVMKVRMLTTIRLGQRSTGLLRTGILRISRLLRFLWLRWLAASFGSGRCCG